MDWGDRQLAHDGIPFDVTDEEWAEANSGPRRSPPSRISIYPKVIVSANGNRTETEIDTHALRENQRFTGGVRRSRSGKGDPRRRFRVVMRAAARCNEWAAARWEDMKQIATPTYGKRRRVA